MKIEIREGTEALPYGNLPDQKSREGTKALPYARRSCTEPVGADLSVRPIYSRRIRSVRAGLSAGPKSLSAGPKSLSAGPKCAQDQRNFGIIKIESREGTEALPY